jgi:uncharacterized protein YfaS (alpha-2-macroglobulin family)
LFERITDGGIDIEELLGSSIITEVQNMSSSVIIRKIKSISVLFVAAGWLVSGWAAAPTTFAKSSNRIVRFTPVSDRIDQRIATANQIVVQFGTKMVSLGSSGISANIFDVNCTPKVTGSANWNNDQSWVYNFKTDQKDNYLRGGTQCTAALRAGVKTLDGKPIVGDRSFSFVVDGPNILSIFPDQYSDGGGDGESSSSSIPTINEDQVFVITTDTVVDEASILQNVYFQVQGGKASRIGVKIVPPGRDRTAVLKNLSILDADLPRTLVLQASESFRFPVKSKVDLVFGPGVKAVQSGVARVVKSAYPFETREELVARFTCYRENKSAGCSPLSDMKLSFSAPISRELARQIFIKLPDGSIKRPLFDDDYQVTNTIDSLTFAKPWPEGTSYKIVLPSGIHDDAGRPLANAKSFPLAVRTSPLPPLVKFSGKFGIVEANLNAGEVGVPVTLRNVEAQALGRLGTPDALSGKSLKVTAQNFPAVIQWLKKITEIDDSAPSDPKDEKRDKPSLDPKTTTSSFTIPLLKSEDGKTSVDTVGLVPLPGPGFYVVEMESKILGTSLIAKDRTMYVDTSALVTNLSLHVKVGRANSLFWVTSLDQGVPVAGAQVMIYNCLGKQVGTPFTTDAQGLARYTGQLSSLVNVEKCPDGRSQYNNGFFVTAVVNNDFTFTHSSWNEGIQANQFGINNSYDPLYSYDDSVVAHTVLDRALLKAGETVSMKHFIRSKTITGFGRVIQTSLPTQVVISHDGDDTRYVLPLIWDYANQIAESTFSIPSGAKLGAYSITLISKDGSKTYGTSRFQVQDFKIPLMKATIDFPGQDQVNPGSVNAQLTVNYQNGGPANGLAAIFAYTLNPRYGIYYDGFDDVVFANGGVEEKTTRSNDPQGSTDQGREAISQPVTLNANGSFSFSVKIPAVLMKNQPQRLESTLEFRDANGVTQRISKNLTVFPASELVGIRLAEQGTMKKAANFSVAVVDVKGKPKAGATVEMQLMEEKTFSHKTRLLGGVYSSESVTTVKKINANFKCENQTNEKGIANCVVRNLKPGSYYLVATSTDEKGFVSKANRWLHVGGRNDNYYAGGPDDRFDLIATKKSYDPGESAHLEAKIPLKQATVLLTVEREGIIESTVIPNWNPTSTPFLDVPIKGAYSPNVYVSVFAVSGRVQGDDPGARATAIIDLGKPSFKMGLTNLTVSKKEHELKVRVLTGVTKNDEFAPQDKFEPRDRNGQPTQAAAQVKVTNSDGSPAKGEIAFAVVDEGLLELMPNRTWDILKNLLTERPLEVVTSTAQMQVIGKRHYGLKAVPLGGDGMSAPTQGRDNFNAPPQWWVSRAQLDNAGTVIVPFPLNDSLTRFRVVAIASSGLNKFGRGEASFTSTKDLIIDRSIADSARIGDKSDAEFSLRNTTDKQTCISVSGTVVFTKADGSKADPVALPAQTVCLNPKSALAVNLGRVPIPAGVVSAKYSVRAQGQDKSTVDMLVYKQKVTPNVFTRTLQAQLSQVQGSLAPIGVEKPDGAIDGLGGVSVKVMDSLTGGLDTIKDHFDAALFDSLEMQVSKAVALNSLEDWNKAISNLPNLLDDNGLVKFYPTSKAGSDVLTAYVLKAARLNSFGIPTDFRMKMIEGLRSFAEGKLRNEEGHPSPLQSYIGRVNAIEVLARYGAESALVMASLPKVSRAKLPNGTLINLLSIYDQFSEKTERDQIEAFLRSSRLVVLPGGLLSLSDDSDLRDWSQLNSPDSDLAELITTVAGSKAVDWQLAWAEDASRMIAAATANLKAGRGAWDTSIANAQGSAAFRTFAQAYEKNSVNGETTVSLGSQQSKVNWSVSTHGETVAFNWPNNASQISVQHRGEGAPWALVSVSAAVPVTKPSAHGVQITKVVNPVRVANPEKGYGIGDILEVTLTIKAQAPVSQLALMDPIPAGAKILGSGLRNDGGNAGPNNWLADYDELGQDGYRAFYSRVGTGEFKVAYRIQLNNSGSFQLPATVIEALYTPAIYAESPNPVFEVVK